MITFLMGTIKGVIWTTFLIGTSFYLGYKANDVIKDNGYLTLKGKDCLEQVDKDIQRKIGETSDKLYDFMGDMSDKVKSMYSSKD